MTNVIDSCYVTTPQATTSTRTKEKSLDIFPFTVTQRSFAPWKRFGDLLGMNNILIKDKRFEGDNRGFSLIDSSRNEDSKARARLNQITQIKTNKENIVDDDAFANRTIGYRSIGVVIPLSLYEKNEISTVKSKATFNANKLTMSVWGSNPLVKLAPDIDWEIFIKFSIINQDGIKTMELICFSSGRGFPAYEAFISDSKNNKFFLFTLPAPGRKELAKELTYPMHDLSRENTIRVEIDNDGNFKGNISVSNSDMSKTPLHGLNKGHQHIFTTIQKWNEYNLKKLPAPDCESNECGKKINNMKLKYIIYTVSIIITLIVIYSSCSCNYEEINYLPEGYVGKVFIIMNQKDGKNVEYLGRRRVYRIPSCGILKTKFKGTNSCFQNNEINNALIYVRIDKYGNVIDTAKALPSFENESERDSFINSNKYNLYFTELGFLSSTFGDTEHYEYIQVSVVDSAKNILEYGFPLMEKEDLEKCK